MCGECGFAACLECVDNRHNNKVRFFKNSFFKRDFFGWIVCSSSTDHDLNNMRFAQIIPGNCLQVIGDEMRKLRAKYPTLAKKKFPIKVTGVSEQINAHLWSPESFNKDFGKENCKLYNCVTDEIITNELMNKFWLVTMTPINEKKLTDPVCV